MKVLLFNEDQNEIIPCENVPGLYTNSNVILCWYHRNTLRLEPLLVQMGTAGKENGKNFVK